MMRGPCTVPGRERGCTELRLNYAAAPPRGRRSRSSLMLVACRASAEPAVLPVQVADIAGGSYPAVIQILAALRRRERDGVGAVIDVSMTDNAYALLAMPVSRRSADP